LTTENIPLFDPKKGTLGPWRIHSRRRPGDEIQPVLDRLGPSSAGVLVWGIGLGYHLEKIVEYFPDQTLLLVEPHPEVWKVVEKRILEFSAGKKTIHFLGPGNLATDAQGLIAHLAPGQTDPPPSIVILPAYRQGFPETCETLFRRLRILEDRRSINLATLKRFGKLWLRNTLRNTYVYSKAWEIQSLFGRFTDMPALLLAGGPSLTKYLPLLPSLVNSFLIVCVDTALRPVLEQGIEPDFVVIVDPQYWNTRHLDRLTKVSSLFVTEISVHPRSLDPMAYPPLLSGSVFPLGEFLEEGRYNRLGAGGSVATTGWDFLRNLGVAQVVCVGMDLGFPELETHVAGSFSEGLKFLTSTRYSTEETQGTKFLYSGQPVYVENYAGEPLLSDQRMNIYAAWFEARLKDQGAPPTYNLGFGSRKIEGITPVETDFLFDQNNEIRAQINDLLREKKRDTFVRSVSFQETQNSPFGIRLKRVMNDLTILKAIAARGTRLIEQFLGTTNPDKPSGKTATLVTKLDVVDQEILGISSRRIIGFLIEDVTYELQALPPPQSFTESLERSLALYRGIYDSTLWLQGEFGETGQ